MCTVPIRERCWRKLSQVSYRVAVSSILETRKWLRPGNDARRNRYDKVTGLTRVLSNGRNTN